MDEKVRLEIEHIFQDILSAWVDLPKYCFTDAFKTALYAWLNKHIQNGRTDYKFLLVMAMHHETEERQPYFEFNRERK